MIITLAEKHTLLDSPNAVYKLLKSVLDTEDEIAQDKEHFWLIHLNARNTIKALELVSLGTLTASLVHPREVFTRAIALRSASLILAHNHPSGDPTPSPQDIELTTRIVEASKILGIDVLDHIIVSQDGFLSMKEQNLL